MSEYYVRHYNYLSFKTFIVLATCCGFSMNLLKANLNAFRKKIHTIPLFGTTDHGVTLKVSHLSGTSSVTGLLPISYYLYTYIYYPEGGSIKGRNM